MGAGGSWGLDADPLDDSIRFVLEAAGIGWWHLDMADNTTQRSLLHDRMFGYPDLLPSWSYDDYLAHVHPDDRSMVAQSFDDALAGGEAYAVDVRVVWPDGTVHWLFTRGRVLLDESGTPLQVAGIVIDIDDRKRAEVAAAGERDEATRALAETVALLETLLKSAPIGFAFVDRDFRFVRVNDALAEMNGVPASDHLGRRVSQIVPQLWPQLETLYRRVLRTHEAVHGVEVAGETRARPGAQRHWVVGYYPVQADVGAEVIGVGVVAMEVTETRRLESHLRQSQKLEAVGLLAGGIAHDFDNALAAIMITAELAQRQLDRGDVGTHLEGILTAARKATGLTRQLLLFSRQDPVEAEVVDVVTEIEEVLLFLPAALGEHVSLEVDLRPVPHVRMDPSQLNQALVNLAINARDAMPGGGALGIATAAVSVSDPPPGLTTGTYVELRVTDTGQGMSHDVLERAYEPFFTTKAGQGGTGLGLATVYGIVHKAGGDIAIASAPGDGTSVRILLPTTTDSPVEDPVRVPPEGRGQRVVVAEDKADLRGGVHELLSEAGYVVSSGTAEQLLDEATTAERPDLLLTDVVMPGVAGPELARRLGERWPGLPVLYMSGYTDGMLADQGLDTEQTRVLRKPFARDEMLRAVADALGPRGVARPTDPV